MKARNISSTSILSLLCAFASAPAYADNFGSGGNSFTIDFVSVGNPGNVNDSLKFLNDRSSPHGGVAYTYRMGVTEVSQDWITKATNLGLANVSAGAWAGNRPAADMTWYEAAAFVNWLNTSTGHQAAYNLAQIAPDVWGNTWSMTLWSSAQAWQAGGENLFRNKNAYYFLPSENEWYKSAFHKNDGVTNNYWDFATGTNTAPTAVASGSNPGTAVYGGLSGSPADVNQSGGPSAYGTIGQGGNVWEWTESAYDGTNDSGAEGRANRGGFWLNSVGFLECQTRSFDGPTNYSNGYGFRVASVVPEPTSALLLLGAGALLGLRRRRWPAGA